MRPVGPELAWRNRRLIAVRAPWPAGVLEVCERLEAAYPGWTLWWVRANSWSGRPAGYRAVWRGTPLSGLEVFAVDPSGVELLMVAAVERVEAERDLRDRMDRWMRAKPR